jgi:hypothetical protein
VRQSIWILIFIGAFLFVGCKGKQSVRTGPPKSDVDFAKEAFKLLADGDLAAAEMLDWEHLNVAGMDAGASYRGLTSEAGREGFHKSFITSYSTSFKSSGGKADLLTNWREQSKDAGQTVVAADAPNKNTILITVSHADGQQKVSALALK